MKKIIDIKLLKYLAIFYTITVFIGIIRKVYWKINGGGFDYYQRMSWFDLFTYNIFLDWIIVILFMIIISFLTKKMFEKKIDWRKIILIHLFFSFFIGYFIFFIAGLFAVIIKGASLKLLIRNLSLEHFMQVVHINFLIYCSMTGIIIVYYYIKKVKNVELQKSQLESQLVSTKLNILKAHLHPHFMFNTLNSISSMIEVDKEKSQNLIADFGDLFRELIEFNDQSLIPLNKELEFLDRYIDIITVRFSDHLTINKEVEKGLESVFVPSMIIQPIVENAVNHAYSFYKTDLEVKISITRKSKYLRICVENNGKRLNSNFNELIKKGTGLKTTDERLKTLFKEDYKFSMSNKNDLSGVITFIEFPFMT